MIKVAVTDANIFIDLIRLDLLSPLFDLDLELHTTSFVVDELNTNQLVFLEPFINQERIFIASIDANFTSQASLQDGSKKLSIQDLSVVFLALQLDSIVLTGDNVLRKYSKKKKLKVHGILWIFDQFVENKLISSQFAFTKLELLLSINNRIPKDECDERFKAWK